MTIDSWSLALGSLSFALGLLLYVHTVRTLHWIVPRFEQNSELFYSSLFFTKILIPGFRTVHYTLSLYLVIRMPDSRIRERIRLGQIPPHTSKDVVLRHFTGAELDQIQRAGRLIFTWFASLLALAVAHRHLLPLYRG